jgi:hypothetical protein
LLAANAAVNPAFDKIFSVHLPDTLKRLGTAAPVAREINDMFEPLNHAENTTDLGELYSQNPVLLEWRDAFRTFDWITIYPDAKYHLEQINKLIALAH